MKNVHISFIIGNSSFTKLKYIEDLDIIEKQLKISTPLITGAKIINNAKCINIFVGKEIGLNHFLNNNYWINKYDLSVEKLIDINLNGFKRACLLNFKKYEQIVIGINDNDVIVPDYYALKKMLINYIKNIN